MTDQIRRASPSGSPACPAPGKSTIAEMLFHELKARDMKTEILDGDEVRKNLSKGLGFSKEDRDTNILRIGYVANLLTRNGVAAICLPDQSRTRRPGMRCAS